MTRDEDDDDDDEDGFHLDGFREDQQNPFDDAWRFGFSVGPDGMRIQEPPVFAHILKDMEEIFSRMDRWEDVPTLPPPQDGAERVGGGSSGNPLRDFMLKSDDEPRRPPVGPSGGPRDDGHPLYESPEFPNSPFHSWTPFSKFSDIWRSGPQKSQQDERKEDKDLDSAVSSGGLDQILRPPARETPKQPSFRSFSQSITIRKVVQPDGTVKEWRTVRDSQGKEETTVTESGGIRPPNGFRN
ncbi:HCLS1-associated protein X-1 isoform X2 [Antennarius striatus]